MQHSPGFVKLCSDARTRIREISVVEAAQAQSEGALLIDVREAAEFEKRHAKDAVHLSKGVIEMKIETVAPELATRIVCYCGGGYRSALVADALQKMGYENVSSVVGGFKAWEEKGLPTES